MRNLVLNRKAHCASQAAQHTAARHGLGLRFSAVECVAHKLHKMRIALTHHLIEQAHQVAVGGLVVAYLFPAISMRQAEIQRGCRALCVAV